MLVYLSAFGVSLLVGVMLVFTKRWHGHFSTDGTFGTQKIHTTPTPRIGGLAVVAGLTVGYALADANVQALLGPMLLAGIPAVAAGMLEDVTKKVGVLPRLMATLLSAALVCVLTGITMKNTGVAPVDWLLGFAPVAMLFTVFAVGGVANAINIIDGFHGLASGAVAIMLGAMGLIALAVGDTTLVSICWLLCAVALGFFVTNWPLGKVFLGDGGAYLMGFLLAWIAVLLPMRNPQVTGSVTLLVCAYPVLEVVVSAYRRHMHQDLHPSLADCGHLHHLIHRHVVRPLFSHLDENLQNCLTSPFCWLGVMLPAAWAVIFAQRPEWLILGFALFISLFVGVYASFTKSIPSDSRLHVADQE